MELSESVHEGIPVIALAGETDRASVGHFLDRLDDHLRHNTRHLVLDLGRCTYLDSAGLSGMLSYVGRMRKGSRLAAAAPNADLRRLFAIAGLEGKKGFEVYESVDQGVAEMLAVR